MFQLTQAHPSVIFRRASRYTAYVQWAAKNCIVTGYDGDTFGPNDAVTREQMAAILYRYAKFAGEDVTAVDATRFHTFSDVEQVSDYAKAPMIWTTVKERCIMKKSIFTMVVFTVLITVCSGCGIFGQHPSESLEKYQIGEYSEKTGHPVLTIIENEESDKKVYLKMDGQDDLAKAMYRYSGMITIDATCSSDKTLLDYSIKDLFTGESYGKLDTKGLYDTFDPRRFETVEKEYQKEIRLSELIAGVTYKYEDVNNLSDGRIINDTGRNVKVYYDDLSDHQSKRFCLFGRCISGVEDSSLILPPPQKNFMIRFQDAEIDDMVQYYNDNMIRLSDYHSGDSFYVNFQTALYNDTGHEIVLIRTDGTEIGISADKWIRLDWNVEDFRTFESDFEVK